MRKMTKEEITEAMSEVLVPLSFYGIEIKASVYDSYVNIHLKSGGIRINYGLLDQVVIRMGFAFYNERVETGFCNKKQLQSALAADLSYLLGNVKPEMYEYLLKYQRYIPRKS